MSSSQYAVFHFDIKTMSMCTPNGKDLSGEDAPLIFNTLEEARVYSEDNIAVTPALGCRVYNHQGESVASFCNPETYDRHHGLPAAKRNLAIGSACLAAGFGAVALDAWFKWRLIVGVLLGIRLLLAGCTRMMDGIAGWKKAAPGS